MKRYSKLYDHLMILTAFLLLITGASVSHARTSQLNGLRDAVASTKTPHPVGGDKVTIQETLPGATAEPDNTQTVTVAPVVQDTTSWRDMLIIFFAGGISTLVVVTSGTVYALKIILSSPILRDIVSKLADSIPKDVNNRILGIAGNLKTIGEDVTELLTDDEPNVPIGQNVPHKQE